MNPRPSPWQGDILPLNYHRDILVPGLRIELRSQVFQTRAVTDLATLAFILLVFCIIQQVDYFFKALDTVNSKKYHDRQA